MARKGPHRAVDLRPEYERLGKWLQAERLKSGRGQREVCRALGKTETYLSKIESGRQRLDLVEFLDLAEAIKLDGQVSISELLSVSRTGKR